MNGASILSVGGIMSAVLSAVGGLAHALPLVGAAGVVMFCANVLALVVERRRRRP